jgi:uncharacterized protein (TIGR03437 family)
MTPRFRIFVPVVSFFCLALANLQAQDRIPAQIDNGKTVVLPHRVHPQAIAANDRGAVADSFPLNGMSLLLKPSAAQQTALTQLLAEQQDPASPHYQKWLTPEQYAAQFGLTAADLGKVTAWLQSQGFTVTNVGRGRTWVMFSGTAGQAGSAFHTQIHRYQVNGVAHYANATDPSIPAALAGVVTSLRGLSDFHWKPRLKAPSLPQGALSSGQHYIAPADFAAIYDLNPLYTANVNGANQKLVVVGQTAITLSDIAKFRSNFSLPAINLVQELVQGGGNPGISSSDLPEAELDIEWSGAVARNAEIIYVYSDDVTTSVTYAIDNDYAPVLSMSYGGCEQADLVDLPGMQQLAQQANAQGITWLAAAGDSGAGDCEDQGATIAQDGFAVDAPGSIPEVTSMGGTEFSDQSGAYWSASGAATGYIPEEVWNDTGYGVGLSAGGGGASVFFPQPIWQAGTGVPNDGVRHVPDLALSASNEHDPYYVYTSGAVAYFGGTSLAAPTMAGIVTLLNQYLAQAQPGLGNINPALYRLAQNSTNIFHDVTVGNNAVPCVIGSPNCTSGSFGWNAGIGYDLASGLGSVDAANFVHLWTSAPAAASAVTVSIDQNPVFQQAPDANGNPWHFTLTLTEEAGVATKLTAFTIDGVSYASLIPAQFHDGAIAANGSISATLGLNNLAAPVNVLFGFAGVDASGAPWSYQMSIPFSGPQTELTIGGIGNAASGQQVYAPGMILSVYGAGLGNFVQSAGTIPLPQYLAGFEATINGVTAPLYYVSPNQVNIQIPYETQPGAATLIVGNPYINSNPYPFRVSAAGPGIFTFPDGSVNPSRTATVGEEVILFITGEGQVTPKLADGATPAPRATTPQPVLPVTVTVGGVPAPTKYVGIPSGLVGVTQINFVIPGGLALGPQPVVVTVGTAASQTATITLQ